MSRRWRKSPMPKYDQEGFDPPAPVAYARVTGPSGYGIEDVPLLVDTGAEVSVVPLSAAFQAGGRAESQIDLSGYDSRAARYDVMRLQVEFLGKRFTGQFVVVASDHGILGRNILNELALALDGPGRTWSIQR